MPISYQITEGMVEFVSTGNFSIDAIKETTLAYFEDSAYKPGANVLVNMLDSEEDRGGAEIRTLTDFTGSHAQKFGKKFALLVAKPLHKGMGNVFAVYMEPYGLDSRTFSSRDEVLEWFDEEAAQE